eukprot:scaffold1047_cov54-Phaeocystis_antarctica.AAC.2
MWWPSDLSYAPSPELAEPRVGREPLVAPLSSPAPEEGHRALTGIVDTNLAQALLAYDTCRFANDSACNEPTFGGRRRAAATRMTTRATSQSTVRRARTAGTAETAGNRVAPTRIIG